jgi:hypothetical protein
LNSAGTSFGGGIDSSGSLTLNQCTLAGNRAVNGTSGAGGGLYVRAGTATLNNCTFHGNVAGAAGGAIANPAGSLTLNQCTLSGNSANNGGAITFGGQNGTLALNQCTLSGNSAINAGGAINRAGNNTFALFNSIVAGNTQGTGGDIANSAGPLTQLGVNLIGGMANLAPLDDYGGPVLTMPPQPGSPATDTGSASPFSQDQRGFPRTIGPAPDLGAVEGVYDPGLALGGIAILPDGTVQVGFSNLSGTTYSVLASTNVAEPLALWLNLGPAVETAPGVFSFSDPEPPLQPQRFYLITRP